MDQTFRAEMCVQRVRRVSCVIAGCVTTNAAWWCGDHGSHVDLADLLRGHLMDDVLRVGWPCRLRLAAVFFDMKEKRARLPRPFLALPLVIVPFCALLSGKLVLSRVCSNPTSPPSSVAIFIEDVHMAAGSSYHRYLCGGWNEERRSGQMWNSSRTNRCWPQHIILSPDICPALFNGIWRGMWNFLGLGSLSQVFFRVRGLGGWACRSW